MASTINATPTSSGLISSADNSGVLALQTGGTTAVTINAVQGVQALNCIGVGNTTPSTSGAGITFPATQSASSDANTLDDYEEGTFTPQLAFGGASSGMTYTRQLGSYTKVGRFVYFSIEIILSSKGSSSGSVTVNNLPFTCVNSNAYNGGANDIYNANINFWTASAHCIFAGTNVVSIQQVGASGAGVYNNGNFNNNSSLYIHGCYQAA